MKLTPDYMGQSGDTGIYSLNLAGVGLPQISRIGILDDEIISGSGQAASGFDLDFIFISPIELSVSEVAAIATAGSYELNLFDYEGGVDYRAGYQQSGDGTYINPSSPGFLFGTVENVYSPTLSTLGLLDAVNDSSDGYLALGEGGIASFGLLQPIQSGFLYFGDTGAGNDAVFVELNAGLPSQGITLNGTDQDDTIRLGEGDNAGLGDGNDHVDGKDGDDIIATKGGNDTLVGGRGSDTLEGGEGRDKALYDYAYSSAAITTEDGDTIGVANPLSGEDTLVSVERLVFTDGNLAFDIDIGEIAGTAYRIYQAAFDRAPDTTGLTFWIDALDDGLSFAAMGSGFVQSAEFESVYGTSVSDEAFVAELYQNILGREGEQAGIDFWVGLLEDGRDRGLVLIGFADSPENVQLVAPAIEDGIFYG